MSYNLADVLFSKWYNYMWLIMVDVAQGYFVVQYIIDINDIFEIE